MSSLTTWCIDYITNSAVLIGGVFCVKDTVILVINIKYSTVSQTTKYKV